ncbi:calcium-binding and coiled-coil domain-containing protein 2 isoform X2 [Heterocephalus glaber]|uniref:Calcium-binding and coiled-coil domain-containing protein 2 n=2 Tax=Heterocephalus glaber TaxID=10181 RepID=A0AAX6R3Q3_HETGA|nr:calcium-binding and coiled-coil domain-containing protein 2 isoform X2 [Heterocephalus glaber]
MKRKLKRASTSCFLSPSLGLEESQTSSLIRALDGPAMEKAREEPPSSTVLLDHASFSQVIFNNVEKFYLPGGDVTCFYIFTQQFTPRRKDWIGIFKVGWKTTREYYTFMWVALPRDPSTKQQEVQFRAYYLPKDDEYYQFCYVDQDGMVRGASVPFQFRPESEEDILVVTTKVKVEETEQHNKELCQENQELQALCAHLEEQNSAAQAELQRKQEELETLQSVNKKLEQESEEQKAHWDSERLQLKEQDQQLRSENDQLGTRVAELQSQLLSQEKEMEELVQGDQEKTEKLQHLKNGNDQLCLSLTEQREQQKKLEEALEEMRLRETAALKTQAALMDENLDLSRRLDDNKVLCDSLQREKELLERENDLLRKESCRLLSYQAPDFDSLPLQVPAWDQEGASQNPGLVFGNPYSGTQESSTPGPVRCTVPLSTSQVPKTFHPFSVCGLQGEDSGWKPMIRLGLTTSVSIGKCPVCSGVSPDGVCEHLEEQQRAQGHCMTCPVCDQTFPVTEKQIFEDHVFCHYLSAPLA